MRLALGIDEKESRIQIRLNSIAISNIQASAYSITWTCASENTVFPTYLDSTVGYFGHSIIKQSAEDIIATTDKLLSDYQKAVFQILKKYYDTQKNIEKSH